jgi:A/G-specific adenine glycosylase
MVRWDVSPPSVSAPAADADSAPLGVVQDALLAWFRANRRDLPWRRSRDPYQVLVSEIMLQQTQVDRVLPYYHAFLERFPTVEALAAAPTAEVIKAWAGLGYNRRAVNLQRTAAHVVNECAGRFPETVTALRDLPGIGPYTAGAIACFAFEQDVAFIDTNMRRVLHRLMVGVDVPSPTASDREVIALAERLLPAGRAWEWNQALIEFGALHCTARKPACIVCPLQATCMAYPSIQTAIASLPSGTRRQREPAYDGSNRFYRGRVVAALRALSGDDASRGIDLRSLGSLVRPGFSEEDVPWLAEVVDGLSRDGLARVAEDRPAYDAEAGVTAPLTDVTVRLP